MKRFSILFLFISTLQSFCCIAQLDSATLALQKTFYNIADALKQPDSVYKLNISKKKIKSWPVELYLFKNLQELNISKNELTHLPDSIFLLTNLKVLNASNNKLTSIPANIGLLEFLTHLNFNRNLIVTIPTEIGNLKNLEVLEMWDNELDTIPDEIKQLSSLRILELRGILFSEEDQRYVKKLVPHARVYFSPWCACANKF